MKTLLLKLCTPFYVLGLLAMFLVVLLLYLFDHDKDDESDD